MPSRPLRQCKHAGCPTLVQSGYCPKHTIDFTQQQRDRFKDIDSRKTPESRKFYSSAAWTQASKLHRSKEPLCRRCKAEGKIRAGYLVHHEPSLEQLQAQGLNPLDDQYLETLCIQHHQQELSKKVNHGQ